MSNAHRVSAAGRPRTGAPLAGTPNRGNERSWFGVELSVQGVLSARRSLPPRPLPEGDMGREAACPICRRKRKKVVGRVHLPVWCGLSGASSHWQAASDVLDRLLSWSNKWQYCNPSFYSTPCTDIKKKKKCIPSRSVKMDSPTEIKRFRPFDLSMAAPLMPYSIKTCQIIFFFRLGISDFALIPAR